MPQIKGEEAVLLQLHNDYRRMAGIKPLVINTNLQKAAAGHAKWMAEANILSHTGRYNSSFTARLRDAGYRFSYAGENIAMGYATALAVVEGWKKSPGHRANMLNRNFKEVGFGIATSERTRRKYWCVDFGTSFIMGGFEVASGEIEEEFMPEGITDGEQSATASAASPTGEEAHGVSSPTAT